MTMQLWAEREIELACKRENPDWDGESFDYGCACYQSALKAYKSLMGDGHSGASFGFTKAILIRLMNDLPLSEITEKDFEDAQPIEVNKEEHYVMKQCPRMGRLFQTKYDDGTVRYDDVDRVACCQIGKDYSCGFGLLQDIVNKMYPITMPYYPPVQPYKIYFKEWLADPKNGDFDTVEALYLITPEGERVEINRYWTEKDGKLVEIGKEEYDRLVASLNK